jgi:hypothetical protein
VSRVAVKDLSVTTPGARVIRGKETEGGDVFRQWWSHALGLVAVVAVFAALALAFAAPSGSATQGSGCPVADTWTAVDFVYSGNYKATGLYEFAWVTYPDLGAAVQSYFGLSEREAYFFGIESFGFVDKNGDQVLCVSYLGANPGIQDYYLSVIDNNANA